MAVGSQILLCYAESSLGTLTFEAPPEGAQDDDVRARGMLRGPEVEAEGQPPARRPRSAPGLEELRPPGAEQLPTAEVIATLEREMGEGRRLATTLATAAGRSAAMVALMAPDSAPAVHTAAEAWRELQQRAKAARSAAGAPPPPPLTVRLGGGGE
eukprot:6209195-Pleurochrysis_carterae.AAC.5